MTNAPAKDVDLWPPNKVLDLKVGQFMDKFFLVNFTAPGDDYDAGKRKKTIISDPDLKAKVGYFFCFSFKVQLDLLLHVADTTELSQYHVARVQGDEAIHRP